MQLNELWNQTFSSKKDAELGWYESDLSPSLSLLNDMDLKGKTVFVAGAGTSQLVDELYDRGARLHLNDISAVALDQLKTRLGVASAGMRFEVCDLGQKQNGVDTPNAFDLWIDRAVLHFLTDDVQVQNYFDRVRASLASGSYLLLAQFAPGGALRCNGLPVRHWSRDQLQSVLGADFKWIQGFDHTFINPKGEPRPYTYALFQRNG